MKRFLILIAALYLIIGSLSAQNITGAWYGNPDLGGVTVRLIFNITEADGAYSGTMQSPDQTDQLFPIGSVELAGGELKITVPALGFVYQGRLTGEKIEGSFTQMGRTYPMELTRSEQTASRPQTSLTAQDITGTWYGAPYLGGKLTRLVFNITEVGGTYGGTMRSPDQGDQSIPLGSVELAGGELIIAIPALDFIYRGRVSGERIDGAFTQRGGTVRVELTREEQIINRPQEPKPKYPYDIEDVTFRNEAAGITLAGTLTVPWGDGPFPAVILVSGSGAQNRDEEIFGHRPFWVLADRLVQRGIAVLRYDDRGVGESEGVYTTATIDDFATDASAALEWLKNQPKIDASRTGVIGHSEGGAIALILAAKQEPAFIVSLAGPGIDGDKLLELQREAIFGASGLPEEYIAESNRLNAKIVDIMMDTDDPAERKARLAALFAGTPAAGQEAQALAQYTPEIESFLRFKPADYYPAIRVPVLALNGEKDLQVIAAPNLEGIRAGITANGNTNVTVKAYPGLNHLFQPAETGLSTEYGEIEITLSPEVMQDIADWILAR